MQPKNVRPFKVVSDFTPAGDQPAAISALSEGVNTGQRFQTLLGITGSGKSATIAWTIEQVQRPTLVLAPKVSKAQMMAKRRQEEQRARKDKPGTLGAEGPAREELAPLTDQDDDWDDEDDEEPTT